MKIYLQSLGCAKNSVDSEKLIGLLNTAGHEIVQEIGGKDEKIGFALINTCAFIEPAVRENIDAILDLERLKEEGFVGGIIVVGCLYNRYGNDLKIEFPDVDFFAKSEDWMSVLRFLGSDGLAGETSRVPIEGTASRYLKIMEGCDSFCSYCTIPLIRGRARSLPMGELVAEANSLCEQGARELCLIGQDPTLYPKFSELLRELEKNIPRDVWLRLLYLHPNRVTREFIDSVIASKNIVPYLDIPIQHIDPRILQSMNRAGDVAHIKDIFSYARAQNPHFALRTTIMVGFPGETEKEFQAVLRFLEEAQLDRVGAFIYSPEPGTPAAEFPNQVSEKVKQKRFDKLMKLCEKISASRQQIFVGKALSVLVEEIDREGLLAWGRSFRDAPEVDGMVGVRMTPREMKKIKIGSFVRAKITDSAEHDLFGECEQK